MFDLDNWQEIWSTITRNKLRSFLTGFGVFWGIFMLIILIGVGNSLQGGIYSNFEGFASNSCFMWTNQTSEAYKGFRKGRWWSMKVQDINLIKKRANTVEYISPMLFIGGGDKNVVRGVKSGSYSVTGIYPDHFKIQSQHVLAGRLLNEIDEQEKRKVCVIGRGVYETLYDKGEDPVGSFLKVNGLYFRVIGVIRPKSRANIGGNVEESIFLPFSTTQVAFKQGQNIWFMACTAKPGYSVSETEEEVKSIVKAAHDISPTDEKALVSMNVEKQFKIFQNLFLGIDFLIWIVGLGALMSGIIGISNIMLVTVKERTKEIGVKRALGAKPIRIIVQIMSESFTLTAIAGTAGFLFGVFILELVYMGMTSMMTMESTGQNTFFIPPFVSFWTAIAAMGVLIVSGVIAGFMPAMRAMKIKAIDAIREE